MSQLARLSISAVGVLHLAFMLAEMFLWKSLVPVLKIYDRPRAEATAAVGANMGIYNGIFGAMLCWLAWMAPASGEESCRWFTTALLSGVVVAGFFGGATIKWTIPLVQSVPALVALGLLWGT